MTEVLTAAEFARLVTADDGLSAAYGYPLVTVRIDSIDERARLDQLRFQPPNAVVVAIVAPTLLGAPFAWADVVLADGDPLPSALDALDLVSEVVGANPIAAVSLALLLRHGSTLDVEGQLWAESSTYSVLQAGAEFARWRAGRPARDSDDVDEPSVQVARDADTLRITLTRPARRNALDRYMRDALSEALQIAVIDPRCSVVIDALGPDFCAGGDLDEFGSRPDPAIAHVVRLTRSPARLLHQLRDRVTVEVHGSCLGSGLELPAFAGRVVAAERSHFGLPELGLGLIPGAGGTASIPRRIGRQRTNFLALSAQPIGVDQALEWGLVDEIRSSPPLAREGD